MNILYRISLFSGLIPIAIGFLVFLYWLVNGAGDFESLGNYYLIFTAVLLCVGLSILAFYYMKYKSITNTIYLRSPLIPLVLLLANVPFLYLVYNSANYIKSTSIIVIENKSDHTVKKLYLSNGNKNYFIEPVKPHDTKITALNFENGGLVKYSFELNNRVVKGTMFQNIEAGLGGKSNMKISRLGNVIVSENI